VYVAPAGAAGLNEVKYAEAVVTPGIKASVTPVVGKFVDVPVSANRRLVVVGDTTDIPDIEAITYTLETD
jgi:hypothetical protein